LALGRVGGLVRVGAATLVCEALGVGGEGAGGACIVVMSVVAAAAVTGRVGGRRLGRRPELGVWESARVRGGAKI